MLAKSKKNKGRALETWIVKQLEALGIKARKQPGSGIYDSFPHDCYFELPDGGVVVEAKAYKHGWRTGDRMMGRADILVMKRNFGAPCVYMQWSAFERLVKLANAAGEIA